MIRNKAHNLELFLRNRALSEIWRWFEGVLVEAIDFKFWVK